MECVGLGLEQSGGVTSILTQAYDLSLFCNAGGDRLPQCLPRPCFASQRVFLPPSVTAWRRILLRLCEACADRAKPECRDSTGSAALQILQFRCQCIKSPIKRTTKKRDEMYCDSLLHSPLIPNPNCKIPKNIFVKRLKGKRFTKMFIVWFFSRSVVQCCQGDSGLRT